MVDQRIHPVWLVGWFALLCGCGWCGAYHVEGHDIFERDLAGAVTLDEDLVDEFWATAGWQAEDEWVFWGWLECVDAAWMELDMY